MTSGRVTEINYKHSIFNPTNCKEECCNPNSIIFSESLKYWVISSKLTSLLLLKIKLFFFSNHFHRSCWFGILIQFTNGRFLKVAVQNNAGFAYFSKYKTNPNFRKNSQNDLIWNFGWHSVFWGFFLVPRIYQMSFVDKIKIIKSVIDINYIRKQELLLKQKHLSKRKSVYSDLR